MKGKMLKDKIKYTIENCRPLYRLGRYMFSLLMHRDRISKLMQYGDKNQDKTILLIRPNSEDGIQGLLSLFVQVMRWVDYAETHQYVPVVDFKNYKTQYSDGTNVWEHFFNQTSSIPLEEVYQSRRVKLTGPMLFDDVDYRLFEKEIFSDEDLCRKCHKIIQDHVCLSDEVAALADQEGKALQIQDCIGVYIRGTDYTALKPSGEFVQPEVGAVMEKIDEFLNGDPKRSIFLVTEDSGHYTALKSRYGERLRTVTYDHFVENYSGKDFLSRSNVLDTDPRRRGIEYLVKIVLLARCGSLITSITRGSIAAYAMNGGKYRRKYIFDLGIYP